MAEIPELRATAEYRGQRIPIMFSSQEWVALAERPGVEIPDAFARDYRLRLGHREYWAKVPRSAVDGVVTVRVTGSLGGQTVSLCSRLPDGRVSVAFIGNPAVAREIGLEGDQYMGWNGVVWPDELSDIHVEEIQID